jgi:hypothetical protein
MNRRSSVKNLLVLLELTLKEEGKNGKKFVSNEETALEGMRG